MTMASDLAQRSPDIEWPDGFQPETADLFAHNAISIAAAPSEVWPHIIDAAAWPTWFVNATAVAIDSDGPTLADASEFTWTTFGMQIHSRINKLVEAKELGWFGLDTAGKPAFAIEWQLTATAAGCLVVLEEAGVGEVAKGFRNSNESALHESHALWLHALRLRPRRLQSRDDGGGERDSGK